jgi:hypothetical protein
MARQEGEHHSPEEIRDYIFRNYTDLEGNTAGISIGVLGGNYRVIVIDTQDVRDTLKIDPKDIDADQQKVSREKAEASPQKTGDKDKLDRAKSLAADLKQAEKAHPHDHERDRER